MKMVDVDTYKARLDAADGITDPGERDTARREILDEMMAANRAEARETMATLESALSKYFETYRDKNLYLMLDDDSTFTREGVTFSRLYGCRIVAFDDQPYEQIAAALSEDEDANLVYYFDVP
jgi:hypothetical protein